MVLAGVIETLFHEERSTVNSLCLDDGLPCRGAGKIGI
jgi:hypothetical protein